MSDELLLQTRNLKKSYQSPGGDLSVLRGIDLEIYRGETVAVMGMSGVGKSTLLNILGLLDSQTSGKLIYYNNGQSIDTSTLSARARATSGARYI